MDIKTWLKNNQFPLLEKLKSLDEVFWVNPNLEKAQGGIDKSFLTAEGNMVPEEMMVEYYHRGLVK